MFTAALRYAEFAGATESGRCGSVDSYEGSGADMRVTRTVFFAERCTRNERMARPESPMKLNFPSGCKWSGGLSLPGCAQDILAKKKKRIRRSEADAMFGRSIDRLNQCNQAATRIEETSDGGREASSRKEKEGEREGEGKR